MRIFFCYLAIILIALQSMSAIAESKDSHQEPYQHSHINSDKETVHHSHQDNEQHSDDGDHEHPDCHANHCHHSNIVYLDLSSKIYLPMDIEKQVIDKTRLFNSLPISPDLRPPIV